MKIRTRRLIAAAGLSACLLTPAITANASSTVAATGEGTTDGRPVLWKNRDHWSTPDGWQVLPMTAAPDGSKFGTGDRYGSRFHYTGVTARGESGKDPITGITIPWAGSNDRGLGLSQVAGHTLSSQFQTDHGYAASQDLEKGMASGYLLHVILSRAETVDEVEQILRDTNDGGGFNSSTARNTSMMIGVFDRSGNAAMFEMDGNSFTRDNVTTKNTTTSKHTDDADAANPADGAYSGWDWRNNFSKVAKTKDDGFPYFVDEQQTKVVDDKVVNSGDTPDGTHDWEDSPSAVHRYTRTAARMDDPVTKDYRYFIGKKVPSGGLPGAGTIETMSRSIGDVDSDTAPKSTGYHPNRFVSTFGFVTEGSKKSDPYDGKLTTIWVALGEPSVSVYVPLFPYAQSTPAELDDMYLATNAKRHQVYDYTDDNACGYSCGRNVDHTIDVQALTGGYYGKGGVQGNTFAIEEWVFERYDTLMADLRTGNKSDAEVKQALTAFQNEMAHTIRSNYEAGTVPVR